MCISSSLLKNCRSNLELHLEIITESTLITARGSQEQWISTTRRCSISDTRKREHNIKKEQKKKYKLRSVCKKGSDKERHRDGTTTKHCFSQTKSIDCTKGGKLAIVPHYYPTTWLTPTVYQCWNTTEIPLLSTTLKKSTNESMSNFSEADVKETFCIPDEIPSVLSTE